MKALIFDIDNTLIEWKEEFIEPLKNVLKSMGYHLDEKTIKKIDDVIEAHDMLYEKLDKHVLLEAINKECALNFPIEFIEKLIIAQGTCIYKDDEVYNTLKYLSQKYDLYVISNWFTKTQKIRLEKMGIACFFKDIIGADINYHKPDKRAFEIILKKYKPDECIYIGDSLEKDIKPAIEIGMHAIWKTDINSKEYQTIKNISDLKNIL